MRLIIPSVIVVIFLIISCKKDEVPETNKECSIDIDTMDFTFGINYSNTAAYLIPGEESDLDSIYLAEVHNALGTPVNKIEYLLKVCHWVNQNFDVIISGGAMAGKNTVNQLFQVREFYGCHSLSLLISSILRKSGFPAIMIETVDVQWGYDYKEGSVEYFSGHVMSEIYVEGKWILLDNNCTYAEDYNPLNPHIPMPGYPAKGYFVFAKGIDIWDYNDKNEDFTTDNLIFFSDNIYCFEELFNTESYNWLN